MDIYGEIVDPAKQKLVMIYHGGFFKSKYDLSLMEKLAADLAKEGCVVVNVEYPRVGQGRDAVEMLQSVFGAFDYFRDFGFQERVVMGHSAGGYYALMMAMRENFAGTELAMPKPLLPTRVIALAPVTDLWKAQFVEGLSDERDAMLRFADARRALASGELRYKKLSPISYELPENIETHIMHGEQDSDVPISHAKEFCEKNPAATLHTRKEDDHYSGIAVDNPAWTLQKDLALKA